MLNIRTNRKLAVAAMWMLAGLCADASNPKSTPKPPAKPVGKNLHLDQAYFAGRLVKLHTVPGKPSRALVVGPWNLGEKVSPGNNDMRPNLYFVSPGTQHRADGRPEYDHNEVLSAVPGEVSNFDVYWVVVLDPAAKRDFTSEQQIILATQETFKPASDFSFDQVPSAGFLRAFLKMKDVAELEKFKRPDGELPRVAIVPARFTVRALAEEMEEPEPQPTDSPAEPKR
jgi:hypothetical protein